MPKIHKRHCNICNKYYVGVGFRFCSRKCANYFNNSLGLLGQKKGAIAWNRGTKASSEICDKLRKSHLGQKAWNKGKIGIYSEETRKRISQSQIGRIPWNKGKPVFQTRGKNNSNWKGGVTPINEKLRKSVEYKQWRKTIFERDNYTCVWCGKRECELNADHIKKFADYPALRFDINNGRTLCKPCHLKTDTYGRK